jgi:hypothetical protein
VASNSLGGEDIDENTLTGINAATLGGSGPSAFAPTGHLHDTTYVNHGEVDSVTSAMIDDETVTGADIDNTLRTISVPMSSFTDCNSSTGGFLAFTDANDAKPHFQTGQEDPVYLRFDDDATPDEDYSVCSSFMVPPDYLSGSTVRVRQRKDIDQTVFPANLETLTCHLTVDRATGSPGTTGLPGAGGPFLRSCLAGVSGTIDPGDAVGISIQITASGTVDDPVDIDSVQFLYTAQQ